MSDPRSDHASQPPLDASAAEPVSTPAPLAVSGLPLPSEASVGGEPLATAEGFAEAAIQVRFRKARPFYGRHPWVLDSAIETPRQPVPDGAIVDLHSDKGKFIARGIYNSRSRIRVRLYAWDIGEPLDEAFWRGRLERAGQFRKAIGYHAADGAARLVFSEADGLSGLIVDRYGEHLVVQVNALAISTRLEMLLPMLADVFRARSITLRSEAGVSKLEGIEAAEGVAWGTPPEGPVFITEHGLRYGVELAVGQKTGFYLDQRENRLAAASYMRGRRVLDTFCYSGGFALAAARLGGASEVLGIDSSERAITLARANAELNELPNVRFTQRDGFEMLDDLLTHHEKFDAVILDPPKFTRSRQTVDEALRAYHRINRVAVDLLNPDGVLVTCSCSGNVTRDDFLMMLSGVSQKTGRLIQVLEQRGASPDHPVAATCLETEYLKCFICRVV